MADTIITWRLVRWVRDWLLSFVMRVTLIAVTIGLAFGYRSQELLWRLLSTIGLVCIGLLAVLACLGYLKVELRNGDRIDRGLRFFIGIFFTTVCVIGTVMVISGFIHSLAAST